MKRRKRIHSVAAVLLIVAVGLLTLTACGTKTPDDPDDSTPHTHTEETIPKKPATCTETGLTEGKKCSVCGQILVEQSVIPAEGHHYENGACIYCGKKEPEPSEGLKYTIDSNGLYYFVSGIGSCQDTELVIPSVYREKPVVAISYSAFAECSGLTSITIQDGVTRISENAFSGCSGLTSILFQGTRAQWNAVEKDSIWDAVTADYTVTCTDGTIRKAPKG